MVCATSIFLTIVSTCIDAVFSRIDCLFVHIISHVMILQCLAVNMSYSTPVEGAKLMFETVYKHIKENVLASVTELKELSLYEQQEGQHEAFLVSRYASVYLLKFSKEIVSARLD